MLVPAMTFGWWLVSMSTATPQSAMLSDESPQMAQAAETPQDTEDESVPSTPAEDDDEAGNRDEAAGDRVTLKVVTPEIVRVAKSLLDLPMGAERALRVEGHRYVFVLERHFHPQGFVGGPNGWHKGVTVYGTR